MRLFSRFKKQKTLTQQEYIPKWVLILNNGNEISLTSTYSSFTDFDVKYFSEVESEKNVEDWAKRIVLSREQYCKSVIGKAVCNDFFHLLSPNFSHKEISADGDRYYSECDAVANETRYKVKRVDNHGWWCENMKNQNVCLFKNSEMTIYLKYEDYK